MAEYSGFFNAQLVNEKYDRVYDAGNFAEYFSMFIGDGVFAEPSNQLKVVPKSGLTVTLKAGKAFIEGYWYKLDEDMDFKLSANSTSYPINDLIVISLNKSSRTIAAEKKENVSSMLPTNNGTVHELVVASVLVGVGANTITESNITDRRANTSYCGFVTGTVEQIDIGELLTQFESQFNDWFETIKGKLTNDVAGSLQNQIDELSESMQNNLSATEQKILKNTAVITKKVTEDSGAYVAYSLNYPSGFNVDNCYIKSAMVRKKSGTGVGETNKWYVGYGEYMNVIATLSSSSVGIRANSLKDGSYFKGTYEYMIVLEKIKS